MACQWDSGHESKVVDELFSFIYDEDSVSDDDIKQKKNITTISEVEKYNEPIYQNVKSVSDKYKIEEFNENLCELQNDSILENINEINNEFEFLNRYDNDNLSSVNEVFLENANFKPVDVPNSDSTLMFPEDTNFYNHNYNNNSHDWNTEKLVQEDVKSRANETLQHCVDFNDSAISHNYKGIHNPFQFDNSKNKSTNEIKYANVEHFTIQDDVKRLELLDNENRNYLINELAKTSEQSLELPCHETTNNSENYSGEFESLNFHPINDEIRIENGNEKPVSCINLKDSSKKHTSSVTITVSPDFEDPVIYSVSKDSHLELTKLSNDTSCLIQSGKHIECNLDNVIEPFSSIQTPFCSFDQFDTNNDVSHDDISYDSHLTNKKNLFTETDNTISQSFASLVPDSLELNSQRNELAENKPSISQNHDENFDANRDQSQASEFYETNTFFYRNSSDSPLIHRNSKLKRMQTDEQNSNKKKKMSNHEDENTCFQIEHNLKDDQFSSCEFSGDSYSQKPETTTEVILKNVDNISCGQIIFSDSDNLEILSNSDDNEGAVSLNYESANENVTDGSLTECFNSIENTKLKESDISSWVYVSDTITTGNLDNLADAVNCELIGNHEDTSSGFKKSKSQDSITELIKPDCSYLVKQEQSKLHVVKDNVDKDNRENNYSSGEEIENDTSNSVNCYSENQIPPVSENPISDNSTHPEFESENGLVGAVARVVRRSMKRMKRLRLSGRKTSNDSEADEKPRSGVSEETDERREVPEVPSYGLPSVRSPAAAAVLLPSLLAAFNPGTNEPLDLVSSPRETLVSSDDGDCAIVSSNAIQNSAREHASLSPGRSGTGLSPRNHVDVRGSRNRHRTRSPNNR